MRLPQTLTPSLAFLAACTAETASLDGLRTTTRDSAGITIVENTRAESAQVAFWQIDSTPARTIGALSGEPAYEFASIKSVRELPGGIVLVLEGRGESAFELRFFDSTGRHIATHGRPGDGPGEFRWVNFVGQHAGDTVVAVDFPLRRISWVSMSKGFVRSIPVEEPRFQPLVGPLASGISEMMVPLGDSLYAMKVYRRSEHSDGHLDRQSQFDIVDLRRDSVVHIASFAEPKVERVQLSSRPSFMQTEIEGGFGVRVVDRTRHRLCAAYTRTPQIVCADARGARMHIRWEADSVPYKDDDRRAFESRVRTSYSRSTSTPPADIDKIINAHIFPTRFSPIRALLLDADGNFWVLEYYLDAGGKRQERFRIFDPDGKHIAFAPPVDASAHESMRALDITRRAVLTRITDTDGVEMIGIFPIRKP